jgi:hypothetical protein
MCTALHLHRKQDFASYNKIHYIPSTRSRPAPPYSYIPNIVAPPPTSPLGTSPPFFPIRNCKLHSLPSLPLPLPLLPSLHFLSPPPLFLCAYGGLWQTGPAAWNCGFDFPSVLLVLPASSVHLAWWGELLKCRHGKFHRTFHFMAVVSNPLNASERT